MKTVEGLRYKRTLYVGLGGAGACILTRLKKKILEANDQKRPEQIRFLLIDTNATELSNYHNFDASEKICIAVREPYERYTADKDKHTHEYIPSTNSASLMALERGAGQVRSNGHFAVIENQYSNKLMRIFKERADELMNIDINSAKLEKDPKVEVRVIFSLAGGTGSGTFLPISILLRAAIKHCELIAYAISPTHYERTVENSAKKTVMANGYAALAELDYMMHFGRNGLNQEKIKFNFGPDLATQQIEQKNTPFDEVYYIDKRTNMPLSDTVEYTYNERDRMFDNTADIIHIASTNIISGHTGTVDNVRQKIREGQFDVEDKFGWASGVGMAEIFLDPKESKSKEIRDAAIKCINNRIEKFDVSNPHNIGVVNKLSDLFLNKEWNESGDSNDDDRVLKKFIENSELERYCKNIVRVKKRQHRNTVELDIDLDSALVKRNTDVSTITANQLQIFISQLDLFVRRLIDGKIDIDQNNLTGTIGTNSLRFVDEVLSAIAVRLNKSIIQLSSELDQLELDFNDAEDNRRTLAIGNSPETSTSTTTQTEKPGLIRRIFGKFGAKTTTTTTTTALNAEQNIDDHGSEILVAQQKALYQLLLKERHDAAIKLLEKCVNYIVENPNSPKKVIGSFITTLNGAQEAGRELVKSSEDTAHTLEPSNRVEVFMAGIANGYKLNYNDIAEINRYAHDKTSSPESYDVFTHICEKLSNKTGGLKDYLISAIQEIDSIHGNYKTKGRQEKTDCQKKIDQLIDLSSPTMQIDGHGFGSKVKADQFYYIMTSDDEIDLDAYGLKDTLTKDSVFSSIKNKTVAGLLQYLLEQNSLDIHVQRVNVRDWKNKAVLYRVKSAVPPYFIEGVAESTLGGQTMEGCYEELKHTRPQYTPFSHKTLRDKLEGGKSVLKPHCSLAEDAAMEHWVNFLWLATQDQNIYKNEFIHFKPEPNPSYTNCKKQQGAVGVYSLESDSLGCSLTEDLSDQKKILILGKTRTEAFHKFSRYCQDILSEHKGYLDRMKHFDSCEIASQMMNLTGEDYLSAVLPEWKYMFFEDDDKKLLRQEMEYVDRRRKKINDDTNKAKQNSDIAEDHKGNGPDNNDNK